jgi:hypothetical protein
MLGSFCTGADMAFDGRGDGAEAPWGCGPGLCDPRALDGVALPEALFAHDPALRSAFFCSEPVEEAFFTPLSPAAAVRACARLARGVEPRRRVLTDHYVDTPDRELFRRGISARVREYHLNSRPVRFEVVVIALDRPSPAARPRARVNRVLVQTFVRSDNDALRTLLDAHARAGLVRVARVDKTRVAFDVHPVVTETADGLERVAGADVRVLEELESLRVVDLGLKMVVDELHGGAFAEPSIVEVEYDAARVKEGAALAERVRAALGPGARAKERNKIAYLLAGDAPPPDDTRGGKG